MNSKNPLSEEIKRRRKAGSTTPLEDMHREGTMKIFTIMTHCMICKDCQKKLDEISAHVEEENDE